MSAKLPPAPRAVITGAGSGLGRAMALELAAQRGRIVVADLDIERAAESARLVEAAGGTAAVLRCDVTRVEDLEAARAVAEDRFGGTDLLCNNAGVAVAGLVGEVPLSDWEFALRVNLWGVIHGCHVFVPRMKAQGSGFILNVASCAGIASFPEMAPYNVSKAAVISLSETMHVELAPHRIEVSVLCPTFFRTNLMESFRSPDQRQRQLAQAFFDRSSMTAEQVARAGLEAVQRGQLIVVPQADGQAVWRAKRWMPDLYQMAMRAQQRSDLPGKIMRWLGAGASRP